MIPLCPRRVFSLAALVPVSLRAGTPLGRFEMRADIGTVRRAGSVEHGAARRSYTLFGSAGTSGPPRMPSGLT